MAKTIFSAFVDVPLRALLSVIPSRYYIVLICQNILHELFSFMDTLAIVNLSALSSINGKIQIIFTI